MNKAILTGELVGHLGDMTTEGNMEVHQAIAAIREYLGMGVER